MITAGFEYRKSQAETPFETFLRYTNEKEQSASKLAMVLRERLGQESRLLDVGTGNGEYLDLALTKAAVSNKVSLTLVEPSDDLSIQLKDRFERFSSTKVFTTDLQSFESDERFDVVLMSHLFYHIPRAMRGEQLARALSLLKQDGALVIVLREKDDVYDFKMAFKPLLSSAAFKALTIEDIMDSLPTELELGITRQTAASELTIPFKDNAADTQSIIEFLLNKKWDKIPPSVRQSALDFLKRKNGVLKQLDGIALVEKQ